MLEKPPITDERIISRFQEEYHWHASRLSFLPIGADSGTAVYRVDLVDGTACFLKLRKNFREVVVQVPLLLKENGIREILIPFETKSGQHWTDFGEYTMIVYPFIEGKDGFDRELTDRHRQILGAALKRIHRARIPPQLGKQLRRETFSPQWRDSMKSFLRQVEIRSFENPEAAKLAAFIKRKRGEIHHLLERAEELASELRPGPLEFVLCHSDIHGGNILISNSGELYIVDWDDPLLAPKERDLMFVGGGIDEIWKRDGKEALFYAGYGKTELNLYALAYYRYERVIEDLAVICEQLLLTDEGGDDREQSYGWFTSNFEPGNTIEIADQTYKLLS